MKGAIEVLRNLRTMCSKLDNCISCPLYDCCPTCKDPCKWTDDMIYIIAGLKRYEEDTHESK